MHTIKLISVYLPIPNLSKWNHLPSAWSTSLEFLPVELRDVGAFILGGGYFQWGRDIKVTILSDSIILSAAPFQVMFPLSSSFSFSLSLFFFFFFFFFGFLGPHPWHMEIPRLGVELELQPPAYTIATATWNLRQQKLSFFFFVFSRSAPVAYGGFQARGLIVAAGQHQSHSNGWSELQMRSTPQLTAMPDP